MYLSRVEIDINNRRKTRDLTHVGAYHNWVEQSFPAEQEKSYRSRKLWRVDPIGGKQYLLIVSETEPDLTRLERYGVEGSAETKNYDTFLDQIQKGQSFHFRVTLNPVVSLSKGKGERGRVVPHVTVKQQMQFFLNRVQKNGFYVEEDHCTIVERGYVLFKKKNERPLRLSRVTFEGRLTVQNLEQFRKTLVHGFGKKKAYGFGMITVVPESVFQR